MLTIKNWFPSLDLASLRPYMNSLAPRYLDPKTGVFSSADPVLGNP